MIQEPAAGEVPTPLEQSGLYSPKVKYVVERDDPLLGTFPVNNEQTFWSQPGVPGSEITVGQRQGQEHRPQLGNELLECSAVIGRQGIGEVCFQAEQGFRHTGPHGTLTEDFLLGKGEEDAFAEA